jgi:hypothetical protein
LTHAAMSSAGIGRESRNPCTLSHPSSRSCASVASSSTPLRRQ